MATDVISHGRDVISHGRDANLDSDLPPPKRVELQNGLNLELQNGSKLELQNALNLDPSLEPLGKMDFLKVPNGFFPG